MAAGDQYYGGCPEHGYVGELAFGGCPMSFHLFPIGNESYKPPIQGWQCPSCGSVYRPSVEECHRCVNSGMHYTSSTGTAADLERNRIEREMIDQMARGRL